MKSKLFKYSFVIVFALVCSCTNKLTRSKAEKIVEEFYEYPNVEATVIYSRLDGSIWGSYKDKYEQLEDMDLISIKEGPGMMWGPNHFIRFTEDGKKYNLDKNSVSMQVESPLDLNGLEDKFVVVASKREFKEITGITLKDENNAQVEFSVVRDGVTPFGQLNGYKNGDILNYKVDMRKYDDGWRIMNEKTKNLKIESFAEIFDTKNTPQGQDEKNNIQQFLGEWKGYNLSYGANNAEIEEKDPSLLLTVIEEGNKIKIIQKYIANSTLQTNYAKYRNGKIVFKGVGDDYYKFQIPTLEIASNGTAKFSTGEGNYNLKHKLGVGNQAPDFALESVDGKTIRLSSLKGKCLLLQFWASWCGPCRVENPTIVHLYDNFKNKGLTILGISIDKSRDEWIKGIQKDGLTWTQVSDLKGWDSPILNLYDISSVPDNILLDANGKIVAQDLRGAQIEEKIKQFLQ
jgi:peroxiredoxin